MSDFHPLEVVGRGSETQLHVGENLNKLRRIRVHILSKKYILQPAALIWSLLSLGAPGCLSGRPIRTRDNIFKSPLCISFFSCGICVAKSRKEAVNAGLMDGINSLLVKC